MDRVRNNHRWQSEKDALYLRFPILHQIHAGDHNEGLPEYETE